MELQVLYTNDLHNRAAAVRHLESVKAGPYQLVLDGGDALAGSNTAFRLREPILADMRRAGYRAMGMGNREFNYLRWVQRWREQERGFPVLAANLQDLRRPYGCWQPYSLVEVGPLRLGLIGLTPVQYPVGSPWEWLTGFRFFPPQEALRTYLPRIESRVDLVLILSHLGLPEDRRLAAHFPNLPLILGGHSHHALAQPEQVGRCSIVQAGSHGRYVGDLRLSFSEPDRAFQALDWSLLPVP